MQPLPGLAGVRVQTHTIAIVSMHFSMESMYIFVVVSTHMTWGVLIYLSPILRMIEAFETIVDTTLQDEDFNSLLVEESDMALLAERVSL